MKQFISTFAKFIVCAFIMYCGILFVWGRTLSARFKPNLYYCVAAYGHTFSRLKEVKTKKNIDILFLGSSHAYRGFDTRIFEKSGYETFNLGSSAQTPMQTKILLKRYLEKLKPKVIIYEVYPATFTIDGVESALDIISNDYNDIGSAKMALELNNIKIYNTFLYGTYIDFIDLNANYKEQRRKKYDNYIPGGFVEHDMKTTKIKTYNQSEWVFKENQLLHFEEIISYLKSEKIEVKLVYAPIPKSIYKSYSNRKEFDSIMKSHGEYINFNENPFLNDSLHYYDNDHLNQEGVTIFNQKLIELLKSKK
jgi:hypothetical protein